MTRAVCAALRTVCIAKVSNCSSIQPSKVKGQPCWHSSSKSRRELEYALDGRNFNISVFINVFLATSIERRVASHRRNEHAQKLDVMQS